MKSLIETVQSVISVQESNSNELEMSVFYAREEAVELMREFLKKLDTTKKWPMLETAELFEALEDVLIATKKLPPSSEFRKGAM